MRWDPVVYAHYGDERSRSFFDLVGRIDCAAPRRVVDLGCATGALTATFAQRWPAAVVEGIDSSPEMVAAAVPGVSVALASVADWTYPADADVVVSNAVLQWVPGHVELLASWASAVPDGGWLAWQVPGNFANPAHTLLRSLASSWGVEDVLRHHDFVASPTSYAALLLDAGLAADVWETTYLHVLPGEDPVLEWMRGTGLRPVLGAVDDPAGFCAEYGALLRTAYPAGPGGTVFPFRRIFAVGHARMIVGYDHVQLAIPHGSEQIAREFYGGVLGMTELPKPPLLAARGGCWFASGAAVLHLGVEEPFAPARKAHPAFLVTSLPAVPGAVADSSIPGVRRWHAVDPFGNRLEFQLVGVEREP